MNIRRISVADVFNLTNHWNQTEEEDCNQKGEAGGSMAVLLAAAAAAVMAVVAGAPGIVGAILATGDSSAVAKDLSLGYQDLQGQNKVGNFKIQSLSTQFNEAHTAALSNEKEKQLALNNIPKNLNA